MFYTLKEWSISAATSLLRLLNQMIPQAPIGKQKKNFKKRKNWTKDLPVQQEKTVPKRRTTDADADRRLWLLTLSLWMKRNGSL